MLKLIFAFFILLTALFSGTTPSTEPISQDTVYNGVFPLHMVSFKDVVLQTNQSLTALNLTGCAGQLKSLYITSGGGKFDLAITIDGEKTVDTYNPNTSPEVTRGAFFFNSVKYYRPFTADDFGQTGSCFWRIINIPFQNSIEVVYTNYGAPINYWVDTAYQNFTELQPAPTTTTVYAGKLHGFLGTVNMDTANKTYTLLDLEGSGRFLNLNAYYEPPCDPINNYLYLEGPITAYSDDAVYNSSGHEEFFLNTFYFMEAGSTLQNNRAGCTDYNSRYSSRVAAYRVFNLDEPMYFNRHFSLVENHWFNPEVNVNYFVLYYVW